MQLITIGNFLALNLVMTSGLILPFGKVVKSLITLTMGFCANPSLNQRLKRLYSKWKETKPLGLTKYLLNSIKVARKL